MYFRRGGKKKHNETNKNQTRNTPKNNKLKPNYYSAEA